MIASASSPITSTVRVPVGPLPPPESRVVGTIEPAVGDLVVGDAGRPGAAESEVGVDRPGVRSAGSAAAGAAATPSSATATASAAGATATTAATAAVTATVGWLFFSSSGSSPL